MFQLFFQCQHPETSAYTITVIPKKTPKCSERVWEVMPETCMGNLERVGPYLYSCYGLWDLVSWRLVEENIYRKQDVSGLLKPWLHHPCLENVSSVISNMRLVSRFQDAGMFKATHSNFQWIRLKSRLSARTRQFRTAHILCHAVAVDDGVALEESTPWFFSY